MLSPRIFEVARRVSSGSGGSSSSSSYSYVATMGSGLIFRLVLYSATYIARIALPARKSQLLLAGCTVLHQLCSQAYIIVSVMDGRKQPL